MSELISTQQPTPARGGCLGALGWFLSGFVMPLGSFTYYRKAAQKSVGQAILFFFVFTLTASLLSSLGIGRSMLAQSADIRAAFEDGTMPEIVIRNGVAEAEGAQPNILADFEDEQGTRTFVAIDTTGKIKQIDNSRYDQGLLLKKSELHLLNDNGDYQVLPLRELNTMFETDPIIINAETATQGWKAMSVILAFAAFIGLAIWNSLVRLMVIALIGLILWGVISAFRPKTGFEPVIISGIYALVPALYVHYLFNRAGYSVLCLQTLLFVSVWLAALFIVLSPVKFLAQERPLRLWRSLLGTPFIIVVSLDLILQFQYGSAILWGLLVMSMLILAVIGFIPLIKAQMSVPPDQPQLSA